MYKTSEIYKVKKYGPFKRDLSTTFFSKTIFVPEGLKYAKCILAKGLRPLRVRRLLGVQGPKAPETPSISKTFKVSKMLRISKVPKVSKCARSQQTLNF